jgi:hypothetical protein
MYVCIQARVASGGGIVSLLKRLIRHFDSWGSAAAAEEEQERLGGETKGRGYQDDLLCAEMAASALASLLLYKSNHDPFVCESLER